MVLCNFILNIGGLIDMMNLIENEFEKIENMTFTENGAIGYKSTDSALVDINYKVSSFRNENEDVIIEAFDKAYNENVEYAIKWLFFVRDIKEGLGERRLFRIIYKRLFELNENLFYKNLHNISKFGRWDDLISLIGINNETDKIIIGIIETQLEKDLANYQSNRPISLLAKWMPSENASAKSTKVLARKIRKMLKLSSRNYRLMLSKLRKYSNVVEVKMCNNKWSEIDYEKVPSLANLKYKNAFMVHDKERRLDFLKSVAKGESKLNMSVATPVDIVSRYSSWRIKDYDETLELAWKNLKDVNIKNTLVVADGSGSMTVPVGGGRTTALDVANALAIYSSEHNNGVYKNKYITFSNRPQFVNFETANTLEEKLRIAREHNEISNTNIEAVFDLILYTAISNKIPKEEMIENILIISDMEFDMAQRTWHSNFETLTESLFDSIKYKYAKYGYQLPKLIFWNVNSRTKAIPLTQNDLGVVLVSGFSQNVLKMVMSNKYNPYEVLIETLDSKRYDDIICE